MSREASCWSVSNSLPFKPKRRSITARCLSFNCTSHSRTSDSISFACSCSSGLMPLSSAIDSPIERIGSTSSGASREEVRDVFRGRLALGMRLQMALRAKHGVKLLDHVHRQPDRARLVHDCALDVLPDPPGGVRGKPKTTLGIEF